MLTDFIVIQSGIFIFGCSCTVGWLSKLHFTAKCFQAKQEFSPFGEGKSGHRLNVLHVVIKLKKNML